MPTQNMEVTMTPQHNSTLENKLATCQEKLRQSRQKVRNLTQCNRDLTQRKDYYKSQTKALTHELQKEKDLKKRLFGCS
jgi:DNA repair ATPase RecN